MNISEGQICETVVSRKNLYKSTSLIFVICL